MTKPAWVLLGLGAPLGLMALEALNVPAAGPSIPAAINLLIALMAVACALGSAVLARRASVGRWFVLAHRVLAVAATAAIVLWVGGSIFAPAHVYVHAEMGFMLSWITSVLLGLVCIAEYGTRA